MSHSSVNRVQTGCNRSSPLRYQLASDLHIEYLDDPLASDFIKKKANVLVLGGDIGSLYKLDQLEKFLNELHAFEKILYIPGNHEFYTVKNIKQKPYNQLLDDLYGLEQRITNLYVLNCKSMIIDDIEFIGCTLWSNIGTNFFPKYRVRIYGFNNIIYQQQYEKHLNFLKKALTTYTHGISDQSNRVVVTHYPPVDLETRTKFAYLYANNLTNMILSKNMKVWNFGHIHVNHMYFIDRVLMVTNQTGRAKDHVQDYVKDFIVTL